MLIRFGAQTWLPSPSAPGSAAPRSRIERNLLRWRDRGFGMAGSAALPPSHSWLRAVLPVVAVLYLGAAMIFVLMLLDILPKEAELAAIVLYGEGLFLLFRERGALFRGLPAVSVLPVWRLRGFG